MNVDILDADGWALVMQATPLVNDVYRLSRVCREARRGLYKVDISYSQDVPLAESLIGRHIVETRDGFLSLSPQENCLTFQVSSTPLKVMALPILGLVLSYDTATATHLDRLAAWWNVPSFLPEIMFDGHCTMHSGHPQVGDQILVIVEVRRRTDATVRPTLRAIATLKLK